MIDLVLYKEQQLSLKYFLDKMIMLKCAGNKKPFGA